MKLEQEAKQKRDYKREPKQEESSSSSDADVDCSADTDLTKTHRECWGWKWRSCGSNNRGQEGFFLLRKWTWVDASCEERCWLRSLGRAGYSKVQPPSPLPSSIDSNSSPEEIQFQPIASKQYTFKMNEDAQEDSDKSEEEKIINLATWRHALPTDGPEISYDDLNGDTYQPKSFVIALGVRLGVLPTQLQLSCLFRSPQFPWWRVSVSS